MNNKKMVKKSVGKLRSEKKGKKTYLLSEPFPVEEIILGNTKDEVLRFLYKGGNPHSISKYLKIARPTTIQHLNELRDKGLVRKGQKDEDKYGDPYQITEKGRFLIEECVGFPIKSSHKGMSKDKKTRGHAFIWKIKSNKKFDWKKLLDEKKIKFEPKGIADTPRIIINKKKVWLGKYNISIFEPKWNSFFNKNPTKSRNDAIYEMNQDIETLKEKLGIEFKYKFTCRRQHYGFVDNKEARFFIKKKKKILIKNEKGYWFTIDFSQNEYKEAETIHEKDALIDGHGYQDLMNSHEKTNFKVTPTFILEAMNGIQQNQLIFAKNMESHIKAIQDLSKGVNEFRRENVSWKKEKVKEIKKELKYGRQTKLERFI
ncbi:hypothetical protein LCGC14_1164670 [marine sediment metagenome]|uniref:HTH arsR-type domain-containing protein n=1 Tax=marine sediment metagenome TaxID=412755 RepID=A0A0F9PX33_9ZZZZ